MYKKNNSTKERHILFYSILISVLYANTQHPVLANEITLNTATVAPLNTPKLNGFLDLVVKEAFARNGYQLQTIHLPAERALKNVNAGIEDGEMLRIKGMEKLYPNIIRVPEKIIDMEFVAFSHRKINMESGWSVLSKYAVSFINGWKIYEENVPADAEIIKLRTIKQLFSLLQKKRTDIILYERWGGLYHIKKNNIQSVLLLSPPLATKEMFIYLHKKHKKLVPKLAQTLKQIKRDGTYKKFANKTLAPLKQ